MKELKYTVSDPLGIHARPAGLLVKLTTGFRSSVTVAKEEKSADAKRLLGVMALGVKAGQEITVTAEGPDEEEAIAAIGKFLNENL